MNFNLDDNSFEKVIDIFDPIREILSIDLDNHSHEDNKGITYLKTKVSDEAVLERQR